MTEELDNELQILREKRKKEREATAQGLIDLAKKKLQDRQEAEQAVKPLKAPIEYPPEEIERSIGLWNSGIYQLYISKKQWQDVKDGLLIPFPLNVERMQQRGEWIARIDIIYRSEEADKHLRKQHLIR